MRVAMLLGLIAGGTVVGAAQGPSLTVVLVVMLLLGSAFFSGSETALFSLQPLDREALRESGVTSVDELLSRPRRTLASILIGNEVVNVTLSTVTAGLVVAVAPNHAWLNVVVLTPVLLLVGEILPKVTALRYNRQLASLIAPVLKGFSALVAPLRWALTGVAGAALRLTGGSTAPRAQELREEHLHELIAQGRRAGSINAMEQEMLVKVFEFGDHAVNRLMTPRPDVVSISLSLPWEDLVGEVRRHGYSRLPVYQSKPDDIIGILVVKRLLPLLIATRDQGGPPPTSRQVRKLLLPPRFVPTSKRAEDLLDEFRTDRTHMAVVVDEHGSLAGVVTLDDLLAELVGELLDETDDDEQDVVHLGQGVYTVQAAMDVEDFEERFEVSLPEGEYVTVGGFVMSQAGEVPAKGAELTWEGLRFVVSGREGHRLTELSVSRTTAEPPHPAASGSAGDAGETSP